MTKPGKTIPFALPCKRLLRKGDLLDQYLHELVTAPSWDENAAANLLATLVAHVQQLEREIDDLHLLRPRAAA